MATAETILRQLSSLGNSPARIDFKDQILDVLCFLRLATQAEIE